MTSSPTRPPRFAERVLTWLLPPGAGTDAMLGDLAEHHARRGRWKLIAHAWYWRQVISVASHVGLARARGQEVLRPDGEPTARPRLLESLRYDLRFAVRTWLRQPALAALMIAALGIGIGATTAIFSVVRAVVLQPLPYGDPGRLALIWSATNESPQARGALSPPDVIALREDTRLFHDVAAVNSFSASLTDGPQPEQIQLGVITSNFLSVLGVRPTLGRDFVAADDTPMDTRDPRNASVVILGHGLWTRRFGGDPAILGRTVRIGGTPMTVIGVLPETFRLHMPSGAGMSTDLDAWTPLRIDYASAPRTSGFLKAVGRLRRGVTMQAAQEELDVLAARFRSELPAHEGAGLRLRAAPMHADVVRHVTPILAALSATVGFLLLIACANVANLLLVRLAARERELSVRVALGGSRGRLVQQLLTESAVIALLAAIAGAAAAWGGVRVLLLLQPAEIPRLDTVTIDGTVLAFTMLLAALCTLLFGLAPALLSSRTDVASALRDRAGSVAGPWRRLRDGFVVAEVALSLVLLVGAGLMLRSALALQATPLGFQIEETLTFRVALPFTAYRGPQQWVDFYGALVERLERLPGVRAVGAASALPASGEVSGEPFALEAARETRPWGTRSAAYRTVSAGYFTALGIPLRAGRGFVRSDDGAAPLVVVVDEVLARATWRERTAIGERIEVVVESFDRGYRLERRTAEVIGVTATVPHSRPDESPPGTIYLAHAQQPLWAMAIAVRVDRSPLGLARLVREEIRAIDPSLPIYEVRTLHDVVAATLASTRFVLVMIALFASAALLLAMVGLYSVIAFAVRQRTTEFGVRLALGAHPARIAWGVVRNALRLGALGIIVGIVAAPWLARALNDLLVGVAPDDLMTLGGASLVVVVVVVAASGLPARRAAALNPADALRSDNGR